MKKLSFFTKLGYGMGDIYGGGASTIISMYYLYFLTDVVRIAPALAGTAFLISKLWDAITDPFMGVITDNTRTKLGRRRPYFIAGILLVFVSFSLMFAKMGFETQSAKFIYVLFTYLLFSTVYTMVWVPYNSLATDLTDDYNERTKLSVYRMMFSNISGIIAAVLAKDIFVDTLYPDSPSTGFLVMGIFFGLFFALPYIVTVIACKENPDHMNRPKRKIDSFLGFLKQNIIDPLTLKPFKILVIMYLFSFMAQDAVLALAVYLLTYYLKIPSMMTLLIPVYGAMLITIPFIGGISKKLGKKKTFIYSCIMWILTFFIVFFLKSAGRPLLYLFGILFGAASAGVQVQIFSMFSDIPDADELFSNERREGVFSGLFAFLRKTGGAIIMFLIGLSIDLAGYKAPLKTIVDGKEILIEQTQTQTFNTVLLLIFVFIPVSFLLVASIFASKYKLTQDTHNMLLKVNKYDKENLTMDQISEIENLKNNISE